jgi:hypothetical protein
MAGKLPPFLLKGKKPKPGSPAEEKAEGPKVEAAEERAYQKSLKAKPKAKPKSKAKKKTY